MLKLKNILKESKVGYLVEKEEKFKAKSTKSGKVVYYKTKDAMDKAIKAKTAEPLDKKDKTSDTKKTNVDFKKDDKPTSKKDQEKSQKAADRKEKKELDKIKNSTITVRKPGKADKQIAIKNILGGDFGDSKDDDHPNKKQAQQKVYQSYQDRYKKEAGAEIKKRLKNKGKDGQPLLTKEENYEYQKEVEKIKANNAKYKGTEDEEFYTEKVPTKEVFLTKRLNDEAEKKADYFDPEGFDNTYWTEQDSGEGSDMFDFGDDDDDFDFGDDDFGDAKSDDYGNKLSKLGDNRQKEALETKMKLGAGQLTKVKKAPNHRVTNKDGKPAQVSVFQDPETKKYYGITDEGDIYESDSEDFRNIKEPTTDARGFDGAVTAKGQAMMDMRIGKGGKEDEYDSTSFADLLDLLGIDTDIDYTNPFAAD
tara:strand:- start:49 stop:1311 length:1263 start_codon:yes stop_codon:yes gene_type:complete